MLRRRNILVGEQTRQVEPQLYRQLRTGDGTDARLVVDDSRLEKQATGVCLQPVGGRHREWVPRCPGLGGSGQGGALAFTGLRWAPVALLSHAVVGRYLYLLQLQT